MDSDTSDYEEDKGGGNFVLHNAAEAGDVGALERLLGLSGGAEGAQAVALSTLFRRLVNLADNDEATPLHVAIINGHPGAARVLLRCGASPAKPCDGAPPLALAACLGLAAAPERAAAAEGCVEALLAAGADPHDRDDGGRTALHWAAAAGRPACITSLLAAATEAHRRRITALAADGNALAAALGPAAAAAAAAAGGGGAAGGESSPPPLDRPEHILASADHDGLTPLHLAAKHGLPATVTQLLAAAADSGAAATTAAAAAAEEATALAAARAKAAAEAAAVKAAAAAAAAEAAAAAAAAADGGGAGPAPTPPAPAPPPPPPPEPVSPTALALLLPVADPAALLRIKTKTEGHTALHVAAAAGRARTAAALLEAAGAGAAALLALADKKGRTAADLARRRGFKALAAALAAAAKQGPFQPPPPPSGTPPGVDASACEGADGQATGTTALLAPEDCLLHRTAPEPILRSAAEPPPENVNRLHVLTRPVSGILHNAEFSGLRWRTSDVPQAPMVDVLKCHDWSYVRGIIQACESVADSPSAVGALDPDTALSRHTMRAALAAAGAVCAAVDEVMTGKARNAFCAVRPPGHHAGPTGVVPSPNDPHGSHGFCLLSNVAIGAAYAMAMHRSSVQRVAILDFDVHHGNGTQACVLNTAPSVRSVALRTPWSEGSQQFPVCKPWMGDGDTHNIFFASVQGYGRRGSIGWFYPGSGATADSAVVPSLPPPTGAAAGGGGGSSGGAVPTTSTDGAGGGGNAASPTTAIAAAAAAADAAAAAMAAAAASAGGGAPPATPAAAAAVQDGGAAGTSGGGAASASGPYPEDPDGEFKGSYDVTVLGGPRVINVGIPGPGGKPRMWRRAWRDKILPALMNFRPDIIIVSAGFDAHRKEDLNLRYVGVTEADYEWLTGQIVQVANACCGGRVVSVLEGGYNLRGGPLGSAFARSVAAHVRALSCPDACPYDPADAEAERAAERALEARKAARAAALAAGIPVPSLATPRSVAPTPRGFPPPSSAAAGGVGGGPVAMELETPMPPPAPRPDGAAATAATPAPAAAAAAAAAAASEEPSTKRRRRAPVDYAALNAQLEKEKAEAEAAAAAKGGST
ncbi:hypothetical protein HYH03_007240 [Edaphochlamys debaryana]|uniref:Histone deacetylase domain-containing protein n=1 Tax=Edaphochlamys debaryana TaxID=47281 RepID=A0A836BZF1_9CHLO|nr:hypothetical protein HYH03_007240 [Edaphochlamys debaryana]|eukprot:KAG2494726.1 hypothetical protein HYH03_007240 [Edaphochlamys debaryana]